MKLACNIDQRGRKARLVMGMIVLLGGSASAVAGWWWAAGLLVGAAAFMIFEGARGWCVLRALGMKTKL